MPEVKPGESQSEYISRCVEYCMKEEGLEQRAALGKCYGMWRQAQKKKNEDESDIDNRVVSYLSEEGTCTADVDKTIAGEGDETTKSLERKRKRKRVMMMRRVLSGK